MASQDQKPSTTAGIPNITIANTRMAGKDFEVMRRTV